LHLYLNQCGVGWKVLRRVLNIAISKMDEQKRELVMVLTLLGFENYETEYHMTKQLSPKRSRDCQER